MKLIIFRFVPFVLNLYLKNIKLLCWWIYQLFHHLPHLYNQLSHLIFDFDLMILLNQINPKHQHRQKHIVVLLQLVFNHFKINWLIFYDNLNFLLLRLLMYLAMEDPYASWAVIISAVMYVMKCNTVHN